MKMVIDGKEYRVSWKHTNNWKADENGERQKSYSQCMIENPTDAEILVGVATCSPKDQFSYAIGRKLSFEKALEGIPDKNIRRRFWEVYLHTISKVDIPKSSK